MDPKMITLASVAIAAIGLLVYKLYTKQPRQMYYSSNYGQFPEYQQGYMGQPGEFMPDDERKRDMRAFSGNRTSYTLQKSNLTGLGDYIRGDLPLDRPGPRHYLPISTAKDTVSSFSS